MASARAYAKTFIPLESNPDVMNDLMHALGLSDSLELVDVWSVDDEKQLAAIPRPVLALVVILPASEKYESRLKAYHGTPPSSDNQSPLWLPQTIDNACGLYAILHAACIPLLQDFIEPTSLISTLKATNSDQRSKFLEQSEELEEIYQKAGQAGSTEPPPIGEEVDLHYICLIKYSDGFVYELDGDAPGPFKTNIKLEKDQDLLQQSVRQRIKGWMEEEQALSFSLLALVHH